MLYPRRGSQLTRALDCTDQRR